MSDVGSCSQLTPAYHGRSLHFNMHVWGPCAWFLVDSLIV